MERGLYTIALGSDIDCRNVSDFIACVRNQIASAIFQTWVIGVIKH